MKKKIKIRKNWGEMDPTTRIHKQGKKDGYNRAIEKRKNWEEET